MQVSTEKKDGLKHEITVTVPQEDVKKANAKSVRYFAKNVKIDGFRKGHIPDSIVIQRFGADIIQETVKDIVDTTYSKAIEESGLDVVGRPLVSLADEVNFDLNKDFTYKLTVEVEPVLEFKPLNELKVKKVVSSVTDDDVSKMIEKLQFNDAKWQVVDDAAFEKGMKASINFVGRCDGIEFEGGKADNFDLIEDVTPMIPGFTEQILNHKANDKFTINVQFPKDYHALNLAGKDAEFDITVNNVAKRVLPEVNADFISKFGIRNGDIESFRNELRVNMERELSRNLHAVNSSRLFDALIAQYGEFDVPDVEVKGFLKKRVDDARSSFAAMGLDTKSFDENRFASAYHDAAVKDTRIAIIMRVIYDKYDIKEASEEYFNRQLDLYTSAYENQEEIKKEIIKDKKSQQYKSLKAAALEYELLDKIMLEACDGEEQQNFYDIVKK